MPVPFTLEEANRARGGRNVGARLLFFAPVLVSLRDRADGAEGAEGPWWLKDRRWLSIKLNVASSGPLG